VLQAGLNNALFKHLKHQGILKVLFNKSDVTKINFRKLLKRFNLSLINRGGGKGGARGLKPPLIVMRGGLAPPQKKGLLRFFFFLL